MLLTTDPIIIGLKDLIAGDNYLVNFTLHNPTNKDANLSKYSEVFSAVSSNHDVMVLLTKDINLTILLLEINILNLRTNKKITDSVYLQCSGYERCNHYPNISDLIP